MNKKKLFSLALVLLLIATISFGTLAWFNDTNEITNTFKVASSDDPSDADKIFSIDVWEKVDTNNDGNAEYIGKGIEGGNPTYEKILPGSSLYKEPVVENTGAYSQYVRVHVTVSDATQWANMLEKYKINDLTSIFMGYDATKWARYTPPIPDNTANTLTYTYYLLNELNPTDTESLFTDVVIPKQLTQDDLATINGAFNLAIKAEAVQTENLTADNAFDAFEEIGWGIGEAYGE